MADLIVEADIGIDSQIDVDQLKYILFINHHTFTEDAKPN
jgi:hypothetical protein